MSCKTQRANSRDPGGILIDWGTRTPLISANAVLHNLKGATGRASGKMAVSRQPPNNNFRAAL